MTKASQFMRSWDPTGGCRFCGGRGCIACPGEAARATDCHRCGGRIKMRDATNCVACSKTLCQTCFEDNPRCQDCVHAIEQAAAILEEMPMLSAVDSHAAMLQVCEQIDKAEQLGTPEEQIARLNALEEEVNRLEVEYKWIMGGSRQRIAAARVTVKRALRGYRSAGAQEGPAEETGDADRRRELLS
jgi:hypothetical protein